MEGPLWDSSLLAKFTTSRHRTRNDACVVAYIAGDFCCSGESEKKRNRSENASHRKGDLFLEREELGP